ncbi:MAG TPA: glycosyltransferase [Thermoleophilaceae bacterium]|jgi:glycosyltransferase involved in cell wall biosynthesis
MSELPLISVIMPVRDEAPILRDVMRSMLAQEQRGFEIEVLAVDGRSTDGSREILEDVAREDSRLRVLDNPHQLTPHALNIGLHNARGDYVCICGSHTVYDSDYLATCYEELLEHDAVGCSGRVRVEPANDSLSARLVAWATSSPFASSGKSFRTAPEGYADTIAYPLFRKDEVLALRGYNERLARNQDNDMNTRLRAAGHRLYHTWKTGCSYRSQAGLRALVRYAYMNGFWNFVTLRENPRAMRLRHFVPMVFVLGTAALLLATVGWMAWDQHPNDWLQLAALGSIGLHLVVGLGFGASTAIRVRHPAPLLMPLYILAFHSSYGVGMIVALLKRARPPTTASTYGTGPRIVFLTHYFHPEVGASQTRILECARLLHQRGYDVTVLTGFPNYPDGVIPHPYRRKLLDSETVDGFRVLRSAVYPAPNRGFAKRLVNHASFAVSATLTSWRAGHADVVIAETPPLFTAVAAVWVKRMRRAKLILNVADLWPESAVQLGALKNRYAIRGAEALERFAYRNADRITAPTPGVARAIEAHPEFGGRVRLLPNAVDVERFDPEANPPEPDGPVIYCGTVGLAQGVRTLLEAARDLEREGHDREFLIVGDGAERSELETLASTWGLGNVRFTGRVKHEQVPQMIESASMAVMLLRDVPLFADALPTKLLEYMAAGRPVVAAASGQVSELISSTGAGIACPPEDSRAVADAIRRLDSDPEAALEMGRRGRRYVEENLSRVAMVDNLERELRSLLEARAPRQLEPVASA